MRRLPVLLAPLLLAAPAHAACPSLPEVARLAAAIIERRPAPPRPDTLSMAEALCARDRLVATLAQPWGDRVGWRVLPGDPPLAGALFHGTLRERAGESFPAGARPVLPARFGIEPRVGAGLVLRIGAAGLDPAAPDHLALLRGVEAVIPFLDLPDLVVEGPLPPARHLALNLGTRLGVLGEAVPVQATAGFARALGAIRIRLSDGVREAEGGTQAAHPLDALAWLMRDLREQGREVLPGEHVAVAGLVPLLAPAPGRDHVARFAGLAGREAEVGVHLR